MFSQISQIKMWIAMADRATTDVSHIDAMRRAANPNLPANAEIWTGDGIDDFWKTLIYNYDPEQSRRTVSMRMSFCYWYIAMKLLVSRPWMQDGEKASVRLRMLSRLAAPFDSASSRFEGAASFFVAHSGRIGWVPHRAEPGDQIFIFQCARVPFVGRPAGEAGLEHIGPCYVHGLMDGEPWDMAGNDWRFTKLV